MSKDNDTSNDKDIELMKSKVEEALKNILSGQTSAACGQLTSVLAGLQKTSSTTGKQLPNNVPTNSSTDNGKSPNAASLGPEPNEEESVEEDASQSKAHGNDSEAEEATEELSASVKDENQIKPEQLLTAELLLESANTEDGGQDETGHGNSIEENAGEELEGYLDTEVASDGSPSRREALLKSSLYSQSESLSTKKLEVLQEVIKKLKKENSILKKTSVEGVSPPRRKRGRPRKQSSDGSKAYKRRKESHVVVKEEAKIGIKSESAVPMRSSKFGRLVKSFNYHDKFMKDDPEVEMAIMQEGVVEDTEDLDDDSDFEGHESDGNKSGSDHKMVKRYSSTRRSYRRRYGFHRKGPSGPHKKVIRHSCQLCDKTFTHGRPFKAHLRMHDDDCCSCIRCREEFASHALLLHHRCKAFIRPKGVLRKCQVCGMEFHCAKTLKLHMKSQHKYLMKNEPVYFCQHCPKGFVKRPSLWLHYREHAGGKPVCQKCGKICADNEEFDKHMKHHAENTAYSCEKCGQSFERRQQYEQHLDGHSKYDCSICDKAFSRKKELLAHCRTEHNLSIPVEQANYPCEECGKVFHRARLLEVHKSFHSVEGAIACSVCKQFFRTEEALQKHLETHTHQMRAGEIILERSHLCPTCGKSYYRKQALQRHMRYHTDERPFSCEFCDYKCREHTNLKRHIALHFSKREFVCETCGAAFHAKKTMETHKLYRHSDVRQYSCDDCSQAFKTKSALARHSRIHANLRSLKCTQCGAGFNRLYNLRRHMRSVHGNDDQLPPVNRVRLLDVPVEKQFAKGPAALGLQGKPPQRVKRKAPPAPPKVVVVSPEDIKSHDMKVDPEMLNSTTIDIPASALQHAFTMIPAEGQSGEGGLAYNYMVLPASYVQTPTPSNAPPSEVTPVATTQTTATGNSNQMMSISSVYTPGTAFMTSSEGRLLNQETNSQERVVAEYSSDMYAAVPSLLQLMQSGNTQN